MARKPARQSTAQTKKGNAGWYLTLGTAVVLSGGALSFGGLSLFKSSPAAQPNPPVAEKKPTDTRALEAKKAEYEIVNSYPHDAKAFLQGVVWHAGGFYESTGQYGLSTLRRVEFPSGQVVKSKRLPPDYFGEGLALVGNKLFQLTWKEQKAFVYDKDTFEVVQEFNYPLEGWGLAYDGKHLILSDGSNVLTFLDPQTFKTVRRLAVTMNGRPMQNLNELEVIEGEIWSNIWHEDLILRIDPESGQVKSYLDLKGILSADQRRDPEAVLNGIAYDPQTRRIFISGKLWPKLFEIRLK